LSDEGYEETFVAQSPSAMKQPVLA
jgi:hypothetical protein